MSAARPSLPPRRIRSVADLRQLQAAMAGALMQPLTRKDGLVVGTHSDYLCQQGGLTSFERLEIYARQYWFRLLDCLFDDFPAARALLGSRRFMQLCEGYLAAHPSGSWTLRNLGSRLPEFIADAAARDVARVEWAQALAFDEASRPPVPPDYIAGADPESLRLGLQPCVVLLQLDHAADRFITALDKQTAEGRSTASQAVTGTREPVLARRRPRLKKEHVHLVVHRHDNRLYFKRLDSEPWRLLAALRDGLPLQQALEAALGDADPTQDWASKVREWFITFGQLGWFTRPASSAKIHRP